MNTVVTPDACARATIAATSPPLEALTYQIHIPWPSKAVPLIAGVSGAGTRCVTGGRRAWRKIVIGPYELEWRPCASSTMIRPECALVGTATTNPLPDVRSRAAGELLEMRAPAVRGTAITIPAFSPTPTTASVPPADTWWGLPSQRFAGWQVA